MGKPAESKRRPARRMAAADRRADILARVLPCFARLGFAAAGTRELAAASGVTEPVLYRHFRDKHALFVGVLELVQERIDATLRATLAGQRSGADRLRALVLGLPANLAALHLEFQVLNGAACASEHAPHRAAVRRVYEALGATLARALAQSDLRAGITPTTAAHFLLETGLGASLLRPLRVRGVTRRAYGSDALELLASALLSPARAAALTGG